MDLNEFNLHSDHRHGTEHIVIHDVMPYLDDYIMSAHDPFVEDFIWSMDDSRHAESTSKELTETDAPRLLLFADKDVIHAVRTSSSSAAAEVTGRVTNLSPFRAQSRRISRKLAKPVPFRAKNCHKVSLELVKRSVRRIWATRVPFWALSRPKIKIRQT